LEGHNKAHNSYFLSGVAPSDLEQEAELPEVETEMEAVETQDGDS